MKTYLFVLCPPFSGSTLLWKLLQTSPSVSAHPKEGQFLDGVEIMRKGVWNPQQQFPWSTIKKKWENVWDMNKPVCLEKSPPNLIRAFEIEKIFSPASFIAMIRNPYAFCEGIRRQIKNSEINGGLHKRAVVIRVLTQDPDRLYYGDEIEVAARFWVKCAQYQMKNIKSLKRSLHFTYEEFADNPSHIKKRILDFLPDLKNLDVGKKFKVHSFQGRSARPISNFNSKKIARLSVKDIHRINAILRESKNLMDFFGYEYLNPTIGHFFKYLKSVTFKKTAIPLRLIKKMASRAQGILTSKLDN